MTKKCATCGKTAKVFVGLVTGGKVSYEAWCEIHAAAAGLDDPHGYGLVEASVEASIRRGDTTLRCPGCDCSQRDFERQGRFGCQVCYTTFAGLLAPLLNRMHRDVAHCGKIPQRGADPAVVRHRLATLQSALRQAVHTEQFEGAAQTRDAIEALKAKLGVTDASPSASPHPPGQ